MDRTRYNALAVTALSITAVFSSQHVVRAQEDPFPDEAAAATERYLESLRRARDGLISSGDFEAALEPAQIVVGEREAAEASAAATDRIMLAIILAELDRHDEAETELLDVVDALQNDEGMNSDTLIMPLRLLGRTYIRARLFPEAVTALTQARDVSRRSAGLFNVETQIDVLDDLTNAQLGLGDTVAARDLQLERLETAQRQFGFEDPQVIPYHYHLAEYLESSRLRQSAREQYETALEIAELHADTEQILAALSNIVRQDLQLGSRARSTLERLQELVTTPQAEGYTDARGIAHAVLGDAALIDEEESAALTHYAQAWQLFEAADEIDPATYFQDPAPIRLIPPLSAVDVGARSLPYAWGTIALMFDVGRNGRVEAITDVSSEPAELMEEAYVERLNEAWFRPALVAGEPTDATDIVFTHYFRFYFDPEISED
jgi:tetratricopeptide (TPR) repeat protein